MKQRRGWSLEEKLGIARPAMVRDDPGPWYRLTPKAQRYVQLLDKDDANCISRAESQRAPGASMGIGHRRLPE